MDTVTAAPLLAALTAADVTDVKGLDALRVIMSARPVPAALDQPDETQRRRRLAAAHRDGGAAALLAEVTALAALESRAAADARSVVAAEHEAATAAALDRIAPAIVRALLPALTAAKAGVTAAEDGLAAHGVTRPRLEYVTPDGMPTGSMWRTTANTIHQEAAQRGASALAAWEVWRAADVRYRSTTRAVDLLRAAAAVADDHALVRARIAEPVAAPHPVDVRTAAELAAALDERAARAFTTDDLPPNRQRRDERVTSR